MKIVVNKIQHQRKLVAVVNATGTGFWIDKYYIYCELHNKLRVEESLYSSLEELYSCNKTYRPIYEGDNITINF